MSQVAIGDWRLDSGKLIQVAEFPEVEEVPEIAEVPEVAEVRGI